MFPQHGTMAPLSYLDSLAGVYHVFASTFHDLIRNQSGQHGSTANNSKATAD